MLTLITGTAGTGKTAYLTEQIKQAVQAKKSGQILIVPEQYSHEAERELAAVCGDSLSLYAEVLSFTALARRVAAKMGGGAADYLDQGGRLLCMVRALTGISSRLKVYGAAAHRIELQRMLLSAIDEMKTACISPEQLYECAGQCEKALADKLYDLALIAESFHAAVYRGNADPADRLSILAEQIEKGALQDCHIYVDGFLDFTAQQRQILRALLVTGANVTVCLTMDSLGGENEVFQISRREGQALAAIAEELGVSCQEIQPSVQSNSAHSPSLAFYCSNLFGYDDLHYDGACDIRLFKTGSISEECELAAALCLSYVREHGCRWRDIAVAVRGFGDYRNVLESVFSHYGVPLYITRMSQLPEKSLPMFIELSYALSENGWAVDDVISLLHTGLTNLTLPECDELENYIYTWQLRAWDWENPDDWKQHPDGYGFPYDEEAFQTLERINQLRRRFSQPLLHFIQLSEEADTALGQAQALCAMLEEMQLPQTLEARAQVLLEEGKAALAREYQQLWEITLSALEQCAAILGDTPMRRSEFGQLFVTMLAQYDVGSIPVSLDRVSAGDFDRMRRRHLQHLIVLGSDDSRLPQISEGNSVFSEDERQQLLTLALDLGHGGEWELWREYTLIYNVFTLPSQSLTLCMCENNADGDPLRPAYVYRRAAELFSLEPVDANPDQLRCCAPGPALTIAAQRERDDPLSQAVTAYFQAHDAERFAFLRRAARQERGALSSAAVKALYGDTLKLSASRIDKLAACKFAYFCQYGLKAKPYQPAAFKPPEIGTFMHYVLEQLAREVKDRGGFSVVEDSEIRQICKIHIEEYIRTQLNDFQEKSRRFIYLFRRLCRDVQQVALDMAQELRRSDFQPLHFELDFSKAGLTAPLELSDSSARLQLTGIADRVDGWLHDGKLYLRVVDYKTGRKEFSLSDIWYGMGLQMLLYLFALEEGGTRLYGHEIVPAGVMYLPARNVLTTAKEELSAQEAEDARIKQLRRSGLVLNEEALLEAWEKGENKQFIPVKFSGRNKGEGLASLEQLGLLSRRIRKNLTQLAGELRSGNICADPYYKNQEHNACVLCDYADACHFTHGENGERCRFLKTLSDSEVWKNLEGEDAHVCV